jgi:methylmalonyl-CoA mutase cobalamin-binding subunit
MSAFVTLAEPTCPLVVLATLPGEHHLLPLDMVGVYLSASDASPRMLGADTPALEIAAAARAMRADAVGVSISAAADRDACAANLEELIGELPRKTELWVGGAGGEAVIGAVASHRGVAHVDGWAALDRKLRDMRAGRAA